MIVFTERLGKTETKTKERMKKDGSTQETRKVVNPDCGATLTVISALSDPLNCKQLLNFSIL